MKLRVLYSVLLIIIGAWAVELMTTAAPLISGAMAVKQFDNSNFPYLVSMYGMALPQWVIGVIPLLILVGLIAIWWTPFKICLRNHD
jgi:hypothetical protein